jgi:Cof subfamily protein (haloacid dehalogenase superfamily)
MIKLIASDLDDTLLDSELRISQENKDAVRDALAQGMVFTIATGRMFQSAAPYAVELGLDEQQPLICYNGALIKRLSGETLYERFLSTDVSLAVVEYGMQQGWTVNVYYEDELYVSEINQNVENYAAIAQVDVKAVGDLRKFIADGGKRLAKILIPGPADQSPARSQALRRLVGPEVEIACSKPEYVEITSLNTHKGRALQWLAEFMGVRREEVLVIGDGNNDVTMLEMAGIGVAVGNASQQAKKAAGFVTNTNLEHGVARAIRQFALADRD